MAPCSSIPGLPSVFPVFLSVSLGLHTKQPPCSCFDISCFTLNTKLCNCVHHIVIEENRGNCLEFIGSNQFMTKLYSWASKVFSKLITRDLVPWTSLASVTSSHHAWSLLLTLPLFCLIFCLYLRFQLTSSVENLMMLLFFF